MFLKLFQIAQALPPLPISVGGLGGATGVDAALAQYWDVESVIVKVINYVISLVGVIAMIMIILGGFWYLTAAGNPEQAKKGGKFIMYALIGIVVITLSYAVAFTLLSAPRSRWDEDKIDYNPPHYAEQWIGSDWSNPFSF